MLRNPAGFFIILVWALAPACPLTAGFPDKNPAAEEGEFEIMVAGQSVGSEKFAIQPGSDSYTSSSLLEFRNPGDSHQKVRIETKLEMDANYVPRSYLFKSDVDGRKGRISGSFAPNQAMFEYVGEGKPRKSGLLLGDRYTLLDSNIYHHFVFLVRLFDYNSRGKTQTFEVVIPQEMDSGILKVSELRRDSMQVRGKKRDVRVLQADSGSLQIELWVDKEKTLQRISVPAKTLDVIRR